MHEHDLQHLVDWSCYGCGVANESGLQAKTYRSADAYICEWFADPRYVAHPGKLHHGLVTTLCFCHGAWAATATAYRAEGRELDGSPEYFYVNQSLNYEILRPIPISTLVRLEATTELSGDRIAEVTISVFAGGERCAVAKTDLIRKYASEMEF
jgi:hypothetical protein